ncbi:MAG: hypothetical protein AB7P03_16680 [Kofleriaceae bacterium]
MRWLHIVGLVAGVAACGGGKTQIEIGPVPPRQTGAPLVGPLCQPAECKCREGDTDAGEPEEGKKRFEIRLGPSPQALWVTLPEGVLYKSAERAQACFYVDLAPGTVTAELRASDKDGVSAAMTVKELGTSTKSWYDTFAFECGSPGVCSFDELQSNKATYASYQRGLHDPCGSVKIRNIMWDHGKAPDEMHPSELVMRFTMQIYKLAPSKPHGSECGRGQHDGGPGGEDAPLEDEGGSTP